MAAPGSLCMEYRFKEASVKPPVIKTRVRNCAQLKGGGAETATKYELEALVSISPIYRKSHLEIRSRGIIVPSLRIYRVFFHN